MRCALRGNWSMACDWAVERIVTLSRLAGATPWDEVSVTLLLDGTYQGVLSAAGIPFEPPDMTEVRAVDAEIKGKP